MRFALTLVLVFWVGMVQAQKNYKITYERSYNGKLIENQDFIIVLTNANATRTTSEQILNKTKSFPYEETFIDRNNPNDFIQQAFTVDSKSFYRVDSLSINNQSFEFFDEQKTILGYVCKKARTVINSNTIDLWYTEALGVKGSPVNLGQNLGLVLEFNRNGNFIVQAKKIETPKKVNILPELTTSIKVDNLTYEDLLWKSRFTTIPIFQDEIINFSDESKSNDSILRFAKGTIALRKIKFDEIPFGSQVFVDLTTQSNGDAYDRTGSVFVIPTDSKITFLDGLEKGKQELPVYTTGNAKSYQGVVKTEDYTPLIELMRFFTPFGIHHYNHIQLKDKTWHNEVTYRQDISELQPVFSGKEVYIGVFIGNYDKGGHKVSLNITIHHEENQTSKNMVLIPIFNTTNVLEMAGQEYATMFDSDKGLEVTFTLESGIKNAQLRYITTGHGGWGGGDEFLPKKNTIILNGQEVFSFVPWRQDCGSYRLYNPASGNFNNGLSSSDYSRSNWCPGTLTNPIMIDLGDLQKGTHTLQVKIPQGAPEGGSFSAWNISGILMGELLER
jgi:GLPGLI family protein